MIPDMEATAWLFWGVSALGAAAFGAILTGMTGGVRATRRELRAEEQREPRSADTETWRGQAAVRASVAVDPEPTLRVAGKSLPQRLWVVPVPDQTLPMPAVVERDATAILADFPPPGNAPEAPTPRELDEAEMQAALDAALRLRQEVRDDHGRDREPKRLDFASAFDVEGDEPDGEDDRDDEPPAGGGHAEPVCSEAVVPRYRPETAADPWPAWQGVPSMFQRDGEPVAAQPRKRIKVRRLDTPARVWWTGLRVRLRLLLAAGSELDPRGFQPGEATALVRSGPSLPSLRTRRQHAGTHRAERVRPHRSLRPGWRSRLDINAPSFPGWGCVPR